MKKNRSPIPYVVISCVLILACCLCSAILVTARIFRGFNQYQQDQITDLSEIINEEPEVLEPTPDSIKPEERLLPVYSGTLEILTTTHVPHSDLNDLARRLVGKIGIPVEIPIITETLPVGSVDRFWVTNTDTNESFQIQATLQYVTDHTYFWIEDGVRFDNQELQEIALTFENEIYPLNREYFGSEWTPGIDGDPHLYIIYASGLGRKLAGYFSSSDEYHNLVHEYSNMHETFMLNADNLGLDEAYTYGVLAHEFQHMIHWNQDRNEEAWLNEGFSELASYINGYDLGGFDFLYTSDPDLQLNDWPNDPRMTSPHYGASFLFVVYFLDRFGPAAVQSLGKHPDNGMSSVDAVLISMDSRDPMTGDTVTADDVFLDWILATYLKDGDILDGRYTYQRYDSSPRTKDTEIVKSCPTTLEDREVHQYGVDYVRISCPGDYTLRFEGSVDVGVLPVDPYSGEFYYWSNKGDDSDMTLTRTFDFQDITGELTLTYWTWYDIEEDWDYVYLMASKDGESWQILQTPSGTQEDPSGNSFGWGYNGLSGRMGTWIQEEVDISQYAGEVVQLRFEYVTDAAVNGEGFLLDDVAIPQIGYISDFEFDDGGWEAAGFVRIQNSLPQSFRLAIIEKGATTSVHYLEMDSDNTIEIPLEIGGVIDDTILVVTGTTRFTRQKAEYQFQIRSE